MLTSSRARPLERYRLSQYEIRVPPLRDRREDIVFLPHRFLDRANEELERNVGGFSEAAIACMLDYHWPGNVRELRNAIARAALRADDLIQVEHLALPGAKGSEPMIPTSFPSQAGRPLPLKEIVRRRALRLLGGVLGGSVLTYLGLERASCGLGDAGDVQLEPILVRHDMLLHLPDVLRGEVLWRRLYVLRGRARLSPRAATGGKKSHWPGLKSLPKQSSGFFSIRHLATRHRNGAESR